MSSDDDVDVATLDDRALNEELFTKVSKLMRAYKGMRARHKVHQIWNLEKRTQCGMSKRHKRCKSKAQHACFTCNVPICPDKKCLNLHLNHGLGEE